MGPAVYGALIEGGWNASTLPPDRPRPASGLNLLRMATWRVRHFLLSNIVTRSSFRLCPLLYTYDVALLGYIEKYLTLGNLSEEKWRTNPSDGWRSGQRFLLGTGHRSGSWAQAEGSLGDIYRATCLRRLRSSTFLPTMQEHSPSNPAPSHSQPVNLWSAHAPLLRQSPSPFPRYHHALSTTATVTGELFLFGGVAHDSYQNDLYVLSTRDFSTTLLQTSGETPGPRYGHGVVLTSTLLLVWGGWVDSRRYDDSLYFLNLGMLDLFDVKTCQLIRPPCIPVSREWTRVVVKGPGPCGRHYHTVTLVGSNLFVFGGYGNQGCCDDIWALNLNRCKFTPRFHEPF